MTESKWHKSLSAATAALGIGEALSFIFALLFGIVSAFNREPVAILAFIVCALIAAQSFETEWFMEEVGLWKKRDDINAK